VNNAGDVMTLDNLHLFLGAGAAALLEQDPPTNLSFSNTNADPVNVEILVGRKATP